MEESRAFLFWRIGHEVLPPEPRVAVSTGPERSAAVKGAPVFGAAKRTLDGEHRSGIHRSFDRRRATKAQKQAFVLNAKIVSR